MKKQSKAKERIVHQDEDGKWYFWNDTWSERHGPYNSEEETLEKLDKYCVQYLF